MFSQKYQQRLGSGSFIILLSLLLLIMLLLSTSVKAQQVDFVAYQVHLTPDLADQCIKGRVDIQFEVSQPGLTEISLAAINKTIYSVKGVNVASHRIADDQLLVQFDDKVLQPGQRYTLSVDYLATPKKGVKFYPDHLFTLYHTEQWLVSHEDIGDRAQIEMWLTLPRAMKAVANGILSEVTVKGEFAVHHWNETRQRPAFTFGFAAGYFNEKTFSHQGIDFRYLYRSSSAVEIDLMFADVSSIYDYFSQISGQPLAQKNYTYVVTEGRSMQEASGFSLIGRKYARHVLDEPRESWLISHELAHEWWGNAVSAHSWSDFWLNEGLVQFLVAAFKAKQHGQDEYDREMVLFKESIGRKLKKTAELNPVSPQKTLTFADFKQNYRGVAYSKGAFIFHMLKVELGESLFWQGLQRYTQSNWESTVTTQQLQQAFESVAGRSLQHFFDTWVYQPQSLKLTATVDYQPGLLSIDFGQAQAKPLNLHWWLAVDDGEQTLIKKVTLNGRTGRFELALKNPPKGLWLDHYQYLPVMIETQGMEPYLEHNLFSRESALSRYWGLKGLIVSDYCQTEPQKIQQVFARLKKTDNNRIVAQAMNWWAQRCPLD
ncbi:MAG: aminopeptidase N [Phenylobacterium sp.]